MRNSLIRVLLLATASIAFQSRSEAQDCQLKILASTRNDAVAKQGQQFIQMPAPASAWPKYQNMTTGCTSWILNYDSEGFTSLTVHLRDAPIFITTSPFGITNGTFEDFAGTITSGVNPLTSTSSASLTALGYYPFIRVQVLNSTSTDTIRDQTGSVNITLNGWKSPNLFSLRYLFNLFPFLKSQSLVVRNTK